jgi:hypothetical protein
MPDEPATKEPASVTVSLGASGAYPPVEFGGKTYLLGHPSQIAKANYEVEVIEAEKRSIAAGVQFGVMTPAEAVAEKARLSAALARGDHKTGKPLWMAYALMDPTTGDTSKVGTGFIIFVYTLFKQKHPEITLTETQAIWDGAQDDLKLALQQVVPDFFAWTGGILGLPPEGLAELAAVAKTLAAKLAPPTPTTPKFTPSS